MALKKIEAVMKETGLTRKALRHYDEKKLLLAKKVPAGKNFAWYYTEEDVAKLKKIKQYRDLDVPLCQIDVLINGEECEKNVVWNEVMRKLSEKQRYLTQQVEMVRGLRGQGTEK